MKVVTLVLWKLVFGARSRRIDQGGKGNPDVDYGTVVAAAAMRSSADFCRSSALSKRTRGLANMDSETLIRAVIEAGLDWHFQGFP
ncbi:hypothetical protein A1F94_000930 [Pyrenophora tritici-repentis]|uniref:Uncharacterized protein n=1 Tax=Pyrenophora tritici-repentis TaxID=45151 RepID=A0A317AJ15_9PLEO|nr:hypothetical protein A1F94_000930 [Pyrenophora tritici-repentis]KAI1513343.1 hypothetical protein Ptr86124_007245 [Pyrenophora tritici-repentis]KAI1688353.1 hypothetical protein KJE20_01530 [Pyrenophora tritici-repentis]